MRACLCLRKRRRSGDVSRRWGESECKLTKLAMRIRRSEVAVLNARDRVMTQPIGTVAYQTGAKIAADKSAVLVWLERRQVSLDPELRPFMDWTFHILLPVLHQRKVHWSATTVEPPVGGLFDHLWEDARRPEKLDTGGENSVRRLESSSEAAL